MQHDLFRYVPVSTAFTVCVQWEDNAYNSTLIVRHMSSHYRLRLTQCMYMSLTLYIPSERSVLGMNLPSTCTMSTVSGVCLPRICTVCSHLWTWVPHSIRSLNNVFSVWAFHDKCITSTGLSFWVFTIHSQWVHVNRHEFPRVDVPWELVNCFQLRTLHLQWLL